MFKIYIICFYPPWFQQCYFELKISTADFLTWPADGPEWSSCGRGGPGGWYTGRFQMEGHGIPINGRKWMGNWGDFTLLIAVIIPVITGRGTTSHIQNATFALRNTQPYKKELWITSVCSGEGNLYSQGWSNLYESRWHVSAWRFQNKSPSSLFWRHINLQWLLGGHPSWQTERVGKPSTHWSKIGGRIGRRHNFISWITGMYEATTHSGEKKLLLLMGQKSG